MYRSILQKIFAPAVFVMNRLRYPVKFFFISFFFLLPLSLAVYFLISGINHSVDLAKKERLGLQYIIPVRKLLQNVQQHRGMMSAYLNGDMNFSERIAEKQKEIVLNEKEIDALDAAAGATLETSNGWQNLKRQWGNVRLKSPQGTPIQSFQLHTDLAQEIIFFIVRIGDTSYLILDPDIDSRYLMDALINDIPFMSERLGQIRAFGLSIPLQTTITTTDKRLFLSLSSLAGASLHDMDRGFDVALQFNSSIQSSLDPLIGKTNQSVDALLEFIDQNILKADINTINPQEYYMMTTDTINEVFNLYDVVSLTLDTLLQQRISRFTFQKNSIFTLIAAMFLLVLYFFSGFYIGVRNIIGALRQVADRMMQGEFFSRVELEAHDELALVAESFNSIALALADSNAELKAGVEKRIIVEQELRKKNEELEHFNKLMVGRELKMVELKKEIETLKKTAPDGEQ
jgi:methyl-accepting chemotaxis protein